MWLWREEVLQLQGMFCHQESIARESPDLRASVDQAWNIISKRTSTLAKAFKWSSNSFFPCDLCDSTFARKLTLTAHKKYKHMSKCRIHVISVKVTRKWLDLDKPHNVLHKKFFCDFWDLDCDQKHTRRLLRNSYKGIKPSATEAHNIIKLKTKYCLN